MALNFTDWTSDILSRMHPLLGVIGTFRTDSQQILAADSKTAVYIEPEIGGEIGLKTLFAKWDCHDISRRKGNQTALVKGPPGNMPGGPPGS